MAMVPPVLQPIIHRLSSLFTGLPVPFESVPPLSPELCVENSLWCDDVLHRVTNSLDINHTSNNLLLFYQKYSPTICSINGRTWGKLHFCKKITRDRANFKHDFCI